MIPKFKTIHLVHHQILLTFVFVSDLAISGRDWVSSSPSRSGCQLPMVQEEE